MSASPWVYRMSKSKIYQESRAIKNPELEAGGVEGDGQSTLKGKWPLCLTLQTGLPQLSN